MSLFPRIFGCRNAHIRQVCCAFAPLLRKKIAQSFTIFLQSPFSIVSFFTNLRLSKCSHTLGMLRFRPLASQKTTLCKKNEGVARCHPFIVIKRLTDYICARSLILNVPSIACTSMRPVNMPKKNSRIFSIVKTALLPSLSRPKS